MLESVPPEILEHIAIHLGTSELKGPPKNLAAFCQTSRPIYTLLTVEQAPSIYAAIFRAKFDVAAPMRRMQITAQSLAEELRARFTSLQRFRKGTVTPVDMWTAVFMMFENSGKNVVQLHDYAAVDAWLQRFLLDVGGGSGVVSDMENGLWPRETQEASLALWLLWLCDSNRPRDQSPDIRRGYSEVLRAYAIGAPKYPIAHQSWLAFTPIPRPPPWECVEYTHYGRTLMPTPPAISVPAILGYIARMETQRRTIHSGTAPIADPSLRWETDWARCVGARSVHRPGALDGAWEGLFTYTEFSVYAAILSGGPPQMLHDSATGQNLQVWRLREYHLHPENAASETALPPGDVLDAFFPINMTLEKSDDQVVFMHASREFVYNRVNRASPGVGDERIALRDVVVFGEGHSSWGTFQLRGRVRSSDALVTILKEYNGGDDRGRWLYRGYLVGGTLIGRWRDSFSPSDMHGYEGCFELDMRV